MPTLDDVVCPGCITAMAKVEGGSWHYCPECGYETTGEDEATVRQMLDGADTGATWMDVDLPRFCRWLRDALGSGSSRGASC